MSIIDLIEGGIECVSQPSCMAFFDSYLKIILFLFLDILDFSPIRPILKSDFRDIFF